MALKDQYLFTLEAVAAGVSAVILMGIGVRRHQKILGTTMQTAVDEALSGGATPTEVLDVFAQNTKRNAIGVLGTSKL